MASPQIEEGYTRIANELLEAICRVQLNGTQSAIVLAVIRETFGFQRKETELGATHLARLTGKHKTLVQSEVIRLIERNILLELAPPSFGRSRVLALNKDYTTWDQIVKIQTDSETQAVSENADSPASESTDSPVSEITDSPVSESIDHINKPLNKPLNKPVKKGAANAGAGHRYSLVDLDNARLLRDQILILDPDYASKVKGGFDIDKWADEFRLIRERDNRSQEDIDTILNGFARQEFWSINIRSPGALRGTLRDGSDRFMRILASIKKLKHGTHNGQSQTDNRKKSIPPRWAEHFNRIPDPAERYRKFSEFDDPEQYDLSTIGLDGYRYRNVG